MSQVNKHLLLLPAILLGALLFVGSAYAYNFTTNGTHNIYTFTYNENFTVNTTVATTNAYILAVGGGGGGGYNRGGGGGAGGLNFTNRTNITTGTYAVFVGLGGLGAIGTNQGKNGTYSSFGTIVNASGGGGAGSSGPVSGANGGSGGGGEYNAGAGGTATAPGIGTNGVAGGNNGGVCGTTGAADYGGAGGSSRAIGTGANSANGTNISMNGTAYTVYASGGSGGVFSACALPNTGINGGNGTSATTGGAAANWTGAGGGGGGATPNNGGDAGNGVVVLSLPIGVGLFSMTALNNYTSAAINTFNANVTINGTTANYGTTNGTINFNFTQGSVLINISANTTGFFFTTTATNWNTSTNYAASLTPWANITARDLVDGSAITAFTVADNTTNYSTTNGYVQIPELGLYNATVYATNYFPGSLINVAANSTQNATLFQAMVTFNATELISQLNITAFTVSNNSILNSNGTTTVAPVLFLKAGNYNITFNKSGWFNFTYPITVTALQNNTQNLSGVYRYILNISVRDNITAAFITTYSVNITSGLYPTYNSTVSTTNGSALFPWINDTNMNITVFNGSVATVSILYNTSNFTSIAPALINISLFSVTTNSITFIFRDEQTGLIINNITMFLTGIYSSYNLTTTNGTIFQALITPDSYTISYYNTQGSYVPRTYFYNLTNGSTTTLTLYLLANSSATVVQVTVIDLSSFVAVPNETIQLLKKNLSSTTYYIVDECRTDKNGNCLVSAEVASATYKTSTIYRMLAYNNNLTLNFDLGDTQLAANTITFQINTQTDLLKQFFQLNSFSSSLTNGSNYFQYVWSDSLGNINQACLQVYRVTRGNYNLVNQSCTSASSGTINLTGLDLTIGNSYYAQSSVVYDPTQPAYLTGTDTIYIQTAASLGGVGSVIIGLGVILTGVLAFAPYLPGMIAFAALGIYVMAVPNVVTIQQTAMILILILCGYILLRSRT